MKKNTCLLLFTMLMPLSNLMAQNAKTDSTLVRIERIKLKQAPRIKAEIDQITEKIKREPGNADNYNKLGQLNVAINNYDEGITDFNQAIFLNKNLLSAYINRSQTQQSLHVDMNIIASDFKPALTITLTNGVDCVHRAAREYELGYKEEAIADIKKALGFKPSENVMDNGMKAVEPNFSIFAYQQLIYMLKQTGKNDEATDYQKELHTKYPNVR